MGGHLMVMVVNIAGQGLIEVVVVYILSTSENYFTAYGKTPVCGLVLQGQEDEV
jgi:hypothetical protein